MNTLVQKTISLAITVALAVFSLTAQAMQDTDLEWTLLAGEGVVKIDGVYKLDKDIEDIAGYVSEGLPERRYQISGPITIDLNGHSLILGFFQDGCAHLTLINSANNESSVVFCNFDIGGTLTIGKGVHFYDNLYDVKGDGYANLSVNQKQWFGTIEVLNGGHFTLRANLGTRREFGQLDFYEGYEMGRLRFVTEGGARFSPLMTGDDGRLFVPVWLPQYAGWSVPEGCTLVGPDANGCYLVKAPPKPFLLSMSEIGLGVDLRESRTITDVDEIQPFAHSKTGWGAGSASTATITYQKDAGAAQTLGTYADSDPLAVWSPTKNGTYVFTHTPGNLTATFNVNFPFTGSGTEADPYVVTSANGLRQVAELGGWVRLGADISSDATLPAELALYLDLYGLKLSGTIINNGTLTLLDGVGGGDPSALTISGSGTVIDNMVKIDGLSFKQRYPWNGLVDISYTISGMLSEKTYAVRFMVTAGETTKTFETTNLVNDVNTYVWDAAASSAFGAEVVGDASVKAQIYCTSKKNNGATVSFIPGEGAPDGVVMPEPLKWYGDEELLIPVLTSPDPTVVHIGWVDAETGTPYNYLPADYNEVHDMVLKAIWKSLKELHPVDPGGKK